MTCNFLIGKKIRKATKEDQYWDMKHGLSRTREYGIWRGMISRCTNPNVKNYMEYGGGGISVCDRWGKSFLAFFEDMGPAPSVSHTLDRYPDRCGNYEPGNVRWASLLQQANNKRNTRTVFYEGRHVPISMLVRELNSNIHPETVWKRIKHGWPVDQAVTVEPFGWAHRG